jgi:hypothetical protein
MPSLSTFSFSTFARNPKTCSDEATAQEALIPKLSSPSKKKFGSKKAKLTIEEDEKPFGLVLDRTLKMGVRKIYE